MRVVFLLLLTTGCQLITQRPADCADGRLNGRETDLDCGGGVCAGCATDGLCLSDGDCASSVCVLNRCAAPACDDDVQNGAETEVDCGGACGPCSSCVDGGCTEPSCTNQQRDGLETDVDCGGACPTCAMGQTCSRTTDCATGECVDGRCGARCAAPLLLCNGVCVDPRTDRANCGLCGTVCAGDRFCSNSQCALVCLGGTQLCAGACVDPASNPAHCGGCNMPCAPGSVCVGGGCVPPCPLGQVSCGGRCVSTQRDPQHCGGCNMPCAPGASCVGGTCVTACQSPLLSCNAGALCVDPRFDPDHCGMCGQPCPPPPHAAPACANATCIIGVCQPGFEDCNGNIADGCEGELLVSSLHCGGCNQPCGPQEACTGGQCCGPLPMGSYQTSCTGCQACNGQLSCMCEDTMMIPRPAQIPLSPPCPGGFHNCNGNLQCPAC